MIVTVLKTTFPKSKPRIITYRDYSKFIENDLQRDLSKKMERKEIHKYDPFEHAFLDAINTHAPHKKKVVRENQKPYVTKKLRKAIMKRSFLENKFYRFPTAENCGAFKKQKIIVTDFIKKKKQLLF